MPDGLNSQVLCKRSTILMGGRFEFTLVDKDSISGQKNINELIAEVSRIENLISDWIPASQVSQVNQNAGIRPVKVDQEVFQLTSRAIRLSEITKGGFDISFAAMDRIWRFDGSMTAMPSPEAIKNSVAKVGYKDIILDSLNQTIFLKKIGMKIGFGALGEGYAADRCKTLMLKKGINSGIVNATGDMSTWGLQPDGQRWKIGITNPFKRNKLIKVLSLSDQSVTTSGSYEKYVEFDGVRYSHIINPATGYPARGLTSVTVVGPGAEMCNGLSTSIMVLGQKEGLRLLSLFPEYSCLMITDKGKVIRSRSFNKHFSKSKELK